MRNGFGVGGKENPGPGSYSMYGGLGGPAYAIGSGSRGKMTLDNTPGPGHYKVPTYIANLPKYTMPDRSENLRYI